MNRISFIPGFLMLTSLLCAQDTRVYTDTDRQYWQAREYFQQEQYSLAFPIFRNLRENLRETDVSNRRLVTEEIQYYTTACGLMQLDEPAESEARNFIEVGRNSALQQKMAYQLGEYYYRKNDIRNAMVYYEKTDLSQLTNKEISSMKFHQGYGYFTLQQYDKAKPLLHAVRQVPDDPNRLDANYYYGFISYHERRYSDAMDAFRQVENQPPYDQVVPFYISAILYNQGQKDKALEYAESKLGRSNAVYARESRLFIGHAYFEKRQFAKALPHLEAAAKGTGKLSREQLYELSYCYFDTKQYAKAAEGFRQLSVGEDSLSQSAMYLLGDASLKLGVKADARNAFAYCASNSSHAGQREVSSFLYGKLSYELGFQDIALSQLKGFMETYPKSEYNREARELLVALLANSNNYRESLELLAGLPPGSATAVQLFPRVAYGRAVELIHDQQPEEAAILLDKVIRAPQNEQLLPAAYFWKGEIAYRAGNLDEAISSFNRYLEKPAYVQEEVNPRNARYNLGYCLLRKENYKQAQSFFSQVAPSVKFNSSDLERDAWMRNADCHYMMRDFQKAASMYATAIDYSWPAADYATYQQAMITGITKPAGKIAALNSFERKFPQSELIPLVQMEIANTYLSDEKYREALPFLVQVTRQKDNTGALKPRAYLNLGIAHYNLNNNKEALDNYRKLVTDYPGAAETEEALESAKAILVEEGRTQEYASFLRAAGRSVSLGQEDSLAYSAAETRYASGDLTGALPAFSDYLKRYPEGAFAQDALYYRSEIYRERKDWRNAVSGYQAIADKGPGKYAEKASHQAAKINYFELENYAAAEQYFMLSKSYTGDREQRLDAMRGLLRSQYRQQKWKEAVENAQELLREKSISTDDKVLAAMVVAKTAGNEGRYADAIARYREVISMNQAAYAAEARYETAWSWYKLNDLKNAEKAALETIKKSGSYDTWITKAYILLGDIFWKQKDYFNARATLQSVVDNSRDPDMKEEARVKLELVTEDEKKNSKVSDN
jgi:TolA-binding protein